MDDREPLPGWHWKSRITLYMAVWSFTELSHTCFTFSIWIYYRCREKERKERKGESTPICSIILKCLKQPGGDSGQMWEPGSQFYACGSNPVSWSNIMPPRICISRKLQLDVEPGFELSCFHIGHGGLNHHFNNETKCQPPNDFTYSFNKFCFMVGGTKLISHICRWTQIGS